MLSLIILKVCVIMYRLYRCSLLNKKYVNFIMFVFLIKKEKEKNIYEKNERKLKQEVRKAWELTYTANRKILFHELNFSLNVWNSSEHKQQSNIRGVTSLGNGGSHSNQRKDILFLLSFNIPRKFAPIPIFFYSRI